MDTRRSFAIKSGFALAASSLNLNAQVLGANERVNIGLIGGRNQGHNDALSAIANGATIKTFCDVDDAILRKISPEFEKAQSRAPSFEKDFRRVLDDKDIDAVIIATPDHWHTRMALLACQAGKDVYLEKPLSQTIREGQLVRDAAKKYNRIVQVGTQRRSGRHFQEAAEYVASGKLGKLCQVKAWTYQVRNSIGRPPDGAAPASVDYDAWLGPAPERVFNVNRFHYNWRFFWDYGNSELGNMGVHVLDVALQGIQRLRGMNDCMPRRISGSAGIHWLDDAKEVPDTQTVCYEYPDLQLVWELRSFAKQPFEQGIATGTSFHGTHGALFVDTYGWRVLNADGSPGPSGKGMTEEEMLLAHHKNFIECVKSRRPPNAEVEIGRLSTTLCHLGNVAHHLKRDVRFDPKTETFDDAAANALLTKAYRDKYPLPVV
jgi:predicted dehydrogenase